MATFFANERTEEGEPFPRSEASKRAVEHPDHEADVEAARQALAASNGPAFVWLRVSTAEPPSPTTKVPAGSWPKT